jgi:D-glycero-beta-D-manno-heptose-7-phosphate kinase
MNFDALFKDFENIRVAVVGDVMLDTYLWGKVDRISPEAPVPIVAVASKEQRIGGAGNVALNLKALGAMVDVISVMGNDADGLQLKNLFAQHNIGNNYLLQSGTRITTNKTRVISRNQQMIRLDAEVTTDIDATNETQLLEAFTKYVLEQKPQVIILEDYNKGVLTHNVITSIIAVCKQHNIITTVDPKRKNFFSFIGVDVFKPNLKEVKEGLNIVDEKVNESALKNMHEQLQQRLQHSISFITLSEKGVFYQQQNTAAIIPTHVRNIADVSGAGDTVIAVASLVYAATKNVKLMAEIANIAGGLVCEEVGTAAINKQLLLAECKNVLS